MNNRFLETGRIVNTHGIQGEVKVEPWCDTPEFLLNFDTLYLNGSPVKVLSARVQKSHVYLCLEGVGDLGAAVRLKGAVLSLDRADVALPEGRHFVADLIGLEVRDGESARVLGTLTQVLTLPAQPVYVVKGEKEYLIPAVDEFILETNVEEGYLRVKLIEGMCD